MAMHQPQARTHHAPRTCSFGYIAREMGLDHLSSRTIAKRLQGLIDHRGFPRPLPTALTRASHALPPVPTDAPTTRSTWLRAAVDCWLDNFLPPEASMAQDAAHMAAAATEMDGNARHLRLVSGGRR